MIRVMGVDPGLGGALAIYGEDASLCIWDMPTFDMTVGKRKRRRVDALELADMIEIAKRDLGVKLVVIEAVGGRPKQSASGGFVFGYTVGLLYMACVINRLAIETIPPVTWKRMLRVPVDDEGIINRANEMMPQHTALWRGARGGAKHDRAEAAILAKFGLEHVLHSVRKDSEYRMVYRNADTGA